MSSENFGLVDLDAEETNTMSLVKLVITYLQHQTAHREHQKCIDDVTDISNRQQEVLHNARERKPYGKNAKQASFLQ